MSVVPGGRQSKAPERSSRRSAQYVRVTGEAAEGEGITASFDEQARNAESDGEASGRAYTQHNLAPSSPRGARKRSACESPVGAHAEEKETSFRRLYSTNVPRCRCAVYAQVICV